MDLKNMVEVAAALAGLVSTSLEVERRVTARQLNTRCDRLRVRAKELAEFLPVLTELLGGGIDEQLTQRTISLTKAGLNDVLEELIRIQQVRRGIKVDDLPPIRRWLLLFVPARSFVWLIQFGFYFVIWIIVLSVYAFKEVSRVLSATVLVSSICSFAVLAALLRYWALMEMRWAEGFQPSPSPIRRSILWYSPASRRELIARAGLLFGLFQFVSFFSTNWVTLFRKTLDFTQLLIYVIVFYAWSVAELSLANNPVEVKFPRNLRFLQWPHKKIVWLWMICFYFIATCTIFMIKQLMTVNVVPTSFRHDKFLNISAVVGIAIGLPLAYLLPMYALNRILLAQSEQRVPGHSG
jgi:hypothetical protein